MQFFQDRATLKVYAFDPSVIATDTGGVYSFKTAAGVALTSLPTTLQPCPNNTPPVVTPTVNYPVLAQAALDKSDVTIIRCYEHAVAVPAAWTAYRTALRAIVAGTSVVTALPAEPAYPTGT